LPFRWHFSGKLVAAPSISDKSMSALEKPVYRFAAFELEPAERRLSEAGKPIALTPKVFDTLVLLVERAGHLVSKDELLKVLWPRGYVDESNLTSTSGPSAVPWATVSTSRDLSKPYPSSAIGSLRR
jgi:hypothetical protein